MLGWAESRIRTCMAYAGLGWVAYTHLPGVCWVRLSCVYAHAWRMLGWAELRIHTCMAYAGLGWVAFTHLPGVCRVGLSCVYAGKGCQDLRASHVSLHGLLELTRLGEGSLAVLPTPSDNIDRELTANSPRRGKSRCTSDSLLSPWTPGAYTPRRGKSRCTSDSLL